MRYLLDTNVISELTKTRPNPGVVAWRDSTSAEDQFLSVLVLGEIRRGAELLRPRNHAKAQSIDEWLMALSTEFERRILVVDQEVADAWGRLNAPDRLPAVDGLLAATALVHGMTLVTRKTADFRRPSIRTVNPFQN